MARVRKIMEKFKESCVRGYHVYWPRADRHAFGQSQHKSGAVLGVRAALRRSLDLLKLTSKLTGANAWDGIELDSVPRGSRRPRTGSCTTAAPSSLRQ